MTVNGFPKTLEIPEFNSDEEEIQWWDTHRVIDYIDPKSLEVSMRIRFSERDLKCICSVAAQKGLEPSSLIGMWIKEKLQKETRQS